MSVSETVGSRWDDRTSFKKKQFILDKMGIEGQARINMFANMEYEQLPGVLMGKLILAYTKRGFTLKEYNRSSSILTA